MIEYRCPLCTEKLKSGDATLQCDLCKLEFDREGNTVFFRKALKPDPLASLCEDVVSGGWKKAVEAHPEIPGLAGKRNCADWRFFIPSGDDVSLLEYGSGKGELSLLLAGNAGILHTVSFSTSVARIVATRAQEAGLKNVYPLALERSQRLPFQDGTFDAFVADRVLNYPGLFTVSENINKAADFLLSEAYRVLKKAGTFYMGVGNPIFSFSPAKKAFGLFRRSELEEDTNFHFNLKAVPGRVKEDALSFSGYKELLKSAGFRFARSFAPLPDPVKTKVTIPLESKAIQNYFFKNLIRQNTLAMKFASWFGMAAANTGILPYAVPYYYFLAEK